MTALQHKNMATHTKRSNALVSNSRTDGNNSIDQSQYEIVVEFELRRQREKTRILEQRLHNKQVFINQMKEYQDELTIAYEKCQEELIITKKTLQKFCLAERGYLEEIQQLKHLVIRLEDEINIRQKDLNRRHYSSVKEEEPTPFKKKQVRSKTLMNHTQDSPGPVMNIFQSEVKNQYKKISKFLKQFLMMVDCFCSQTKDTSLKNRLKRSWKWVKEVVKQWNELANDKQAWDSFLMRANKNNRFSRQGNSEQIYNKILAFLKTK